MIGKESQYDWAILPEDLPKRNLVLITAKTPHPTFHKEDKRFPVRLFTTDELFEAARSLAHRPIGLNHLGLIAKAFTVDSQFNKSTNNVEALCYFPDEWIGKVRTLLAEGKESIFSVEYTWRDERFTPEGVEFIGLIFDKVDLLCGLNAGDKFTSAKLVESAIQLSHRVGLMESVGAELIQQEQISQPAEGLTFFKKEECIECAECKGECLPECLEKHREEVGKPVSSPSTGPQMPSKSEGLPDMPEKTNILDGSPQQPISNQDPPHTTEPIVNVASAGFVADDKGFIGGEPSNTKPPVTLAGIESNPVIDGLNDVLGPDKSNEDTYTKVESEKRMSEAEKPIVTKPEDKPADKPADKPVDQPDPKLVEAKKKLSESLATISTLEGRVKELEPVVNKLQENAKTYDSDKAKARKEGKAEGKQEVINKMKTVIPPTSFVSGNLQGSYRVLVNDLKKKVYESENSK